ncbi:MAG: hypothetical protein JW776_02275 [Candidatus Lokiarchaeota archaeon]|nr:hypothetical protein [Candidatus Lokiarchaeota archaeon]
MVDWAEIALLWWILGRKKKPRCEHCIWYENRILGRNQWCHYHKCRKYPWELCKHYQPS